MNKQIRSNQRKNLIFISLSLLVLMTLVNITISYASNTFTSNKVKEETSEFLLLTTYLIDENDLHVAVEYVGHYSDSHDVEVEIFDGDELIFTSVKGEFIYTTHTVSTTQGEFIVNIDNSHSVTVELMQQKYLYANIISAVLFIITIVTLYVWNKRVSKEIEDDVNSILSYIEEEEPEEHEYLYTEFEKIHNRIDNYVKEIDMFRERKQLNIKGLAHDIKTPLTVINNFLQQTDDKSQLRENSILSLNKISRFIEKLIEDDYKGTFVELNLNVLINDAINYYNKILRTRGIKIDFKAHDECIVNWNARDFKVILENMLSNAYYYSNENSVYTIDISKKEDKTILKFTSIGNVSNIKDLKKIFDKGFRDSKNKALNSHGKGLGLYITKLLLSPINGEIKASIKGDAITFKITI